MVVPADVAAVEAQAVGEERVRAVPRRRAPIVAVGARAAQRGTVAEVGGGEEDGSAIHLARDLISVLAIHRCPRPFAFANELFYFI